MSALQIKQRIESILAYMHPYWDLVNCHMVNYLTDNHWESFVPHQLRKEVKNGAQQVQRCIETVFWCCSGEKLETSDFAAFSEFLKESERHRLQNFPNVLTTVNNLEEKLGGFKRAEDVNLSIKEFMSEKKRHEVEITAQLVDDLIKRFQSINSNDDLFVIDAGDGKGYLSSRLALQYKHKVLGIDSNETNTKNALERSRKLQSAWKGLTERAALENIGITPPRRGKAPKQQVNKNNPQDNKARNTLENYKTTSKFITIDLDFVQLLRKHFPTTNSVPVSNVQFCLSGLHTCGNLAPTCLKLFNAQQQFKILCNIGCCYHLLKEEFSGKEFFGNKSIMELQTDPGFPMSNFLREKQVRLGRNARMLAAQSIERTIAAKELPNISLYYRALLEVLICEKNPNLKDAAQVGKVRKFSDFKNYLDICNHKAQLQLENISQERIKQLQGEFEVDRHYLDLFYLLRMTFAPVLESLILLDRLLYLQELNYEHSFLISLFDAVISPRHFCIVAIKS